MKLKEIKEAEFSKYKINMKTFYQDSKMDDWSKSKDYKVYYVGLYDDKKLVGATRLTAKKGKFNKYYFYAPRGFLTDYNNEVILKHFTEELKKFIKSKNGYVLHIDPPIIHKERDINGDTLENGIDNEKIVLSLKKLGYKHAGFTTGYDLKTQGRWHFVLDLDKTYEQISKNMRESTRRKIKKAKKSGVEIVELKFDELDKFKTITSETSKRKGFSDRTLEYYQQMKKSFGNDVKFLLARLNVKSYLENIDKKIEEENKKIESKKYNQNEIIERIKNLENDKLLVDAKQKYIDLSVAMFIKYNDEMIYLFGGSYEKYMKLYSQYLLQDYMIRQAIDFNLKRYNFYGITGNFNKTDSAYGVYDFKKSFGGYVLEYIGDFYLPITNYYYFLKYLKKITRRL